MSEHHRHRQTPPPHKKQIRYFGVFAPGAAWRRDVVLRPKPPVRGKQPSDYVDCGLGKAAASREEIQPGHQVSRLTWSLAMARTFKLDVLNCHCGGRRAVIAFIPSGEIATKVLAHLKLPVNAEGFLPIRAPPWTDDWGWLEPANDAPDLAADIDRPFWDDEAA